MKCECGGTLRATTIKEFDFAPMAGIPCKLVNPPGFRCSKCGYETVAGDVIGRSLAVLTVEVAKVPMRLTPSLARFLRKRLGLTQQELADRMGIGREWVAKWECGMAEISPQHDVVLRVFALARSSGLPEAVLAAVREFDHVHTEPPKMPAPFQIDAALKHLRPRASDSSGPTKN